MGTDRFAVVDPAEVDGEPFPESGIHHRKLTELLGCTEMRVNTVTLQPGQATAPHAHEQQEEVYVALDGGHVRVDDTVHGVPAGGIVRVGPDPVRGVLNRSDKAAQTWVMFGAPPVGTVDDFGQYEMPDE